MSPTRAGESIVAAVLEVRRNDPADYGVDVEFVRAGSGKPAMLAHCSEASVQLMGGHSCARVSVLLGSLQGT